MFIFTYSSDYERIPLMESERMYGLGMSDCIKPDDIVGAHEIAERLHVSRPQVVHRWRARHLDFPKPIATLKTALIWDWGAVKEWAKNTGRLP